MQQASQCPCSHPAAGVWDQGKGRLGVLRGQQVKTLSRAPMPSPHRFIPPDPLYRLGTGAPLTDNPPTPRGPIRDAFQPLGTCICLDGQSSPSLGQGSPLGDMVQPIGTPFHPYGPASRVPLMENGREAAGPPKGMTA